MLFELPKNCDRIFKRKLRRKPVNSEQQCFFILICLKSGIKENKFKKIILMHPYKRTNKQTNTIIKMASSVSEILSSLFFIYSIKFYLSNEMIKN